MAWLDWEKVARRKKNRNLLTRIWMILSFLSEFVVFDLEVLFLALLSRSVVLVLVVAVVVLVVEMSSVDVVVVVEDIGA